MSRGSLVSKTENVDTKYSKLKSASLCPFFDLRKRLLVASTRSAAPNAGTWPKKSGIWLKLASLFIASERRCVAVSLCVAGQTSARTA